MMLKTQYRDQDFEEVGINNRTEFTISGLRAISITGKTGDKAE